MATTKFDFTVQYLPDAVKGRIDGPDQRCEFTPEKGTKVKTSDGVGHVVTLIAAVTDDQGRGIWEYSAGKGTWPASDLTTPNDEPVVMDGDFAYGVEWAYDPDATGGWDWLEPHPITPLRKKAPAKSAPAKAAPAKKAPAKKATAESAPAKKAAKRVAPGKAAQKPAKALPAKAAPVTKAAGRSGPAAKKAASAAKRQG